MQIDVSIEGTASGYGNQTVQIGKEYQQSEPTLGKKGKGISVKGNQLYANREGDISKG